MVSREQANVYRKHREANDKAGNLAWVGRFRGKALEISPPARSGDVEQLLEMSEDERVVYRLMQLPRRLADLERTGVLDEDSLRAFLRGLVSADVVDVIDDKDAKALIPAEVRKARANVQGKEWRTPVGGLQAKVYRPDIDGQSGAVPVATSTSTSTSPSTSTSIPAGATPSAGTPTLADAPRPTTPPRTATPAPASAALSEEDRARKEQLVEAAAAADKQDHYDFIGVRQGADDATIRSAYMALARDYHPDRLGGSGLAHDEKARAAIEQLFRRLGEAYAAIGTREARSRYDHEQSLRKKSGAPASTTSDQARARRPVEARAAFTMAETYFKKREFAQAETHYKKAISFDNEEPAIQVAFAWCISQNPERPQAQRLDDAKKRLTEIVAKFKHGDASYKLGRILRDLGDERGAMKAFENAVRLSPGHVDAQREVRLADSRRQKAQDDADAEKSLLGKLFKRK